MVKPHKWSSLPDDIIRSILSHITLFQNSIVSSTTININLGRDVKNPDSWKVLENLVTIFSSPLINTFRLHLPEYCFVKPHSWNIIDSWAHQLRNVQHFTIATFTSRTGFSDCGRRVYAPCVFQMHSLVSLEVNLSINGFIWYPNSINLPYLKKLTLSMVNYYAFLERLIIGCPSLEEFGLNVINPQKVLVSIPSKTLLRLDINLRGKSCPEFIFDVPKLEHMCFSGEAYIRMFKSISHVKSLRINMDRMVEHTNGFGKIRFPNLTRLTMRSTSFKRFKEISLIFDCPNLEVIAFNFRGWNGIQEPIVVPLEFEQVKRLELDTTLRFNRQLLFLVMFLLRSNRVLEKLSLDSWSLWYNNCNDDLTEGEFYRSLLECPRYSPCCEIELLGAFKPLISP